VRYRFCSTSIGSLETPVRLLFLVNVFVRLSFQSYRSTSRNVNAFSNALRAAKLPLSKPSLSKAQRGAANDVAILARALQAHFKPSHKCRDATS